PRVGDHDVDPAERLDRVLGELLVRLLGAQVAGEQVDRATRSLDRGLRLLGLGLLLGQVGDRDARALLGEGDRRRAPDPRVAARDERPLAGEPVPAHVGLLPVVGDRRHAGGLTRPGLLLRRDLARVGLGHWKASLTFSPACLRFALAWSALPSASSFSSSVAWPAFSLILPCASSATLRILSSVPMSVPPSTGRILARS